MYFQCGCHYLFIEVLDDQLVRVLTGLNCLDGYESSDLLDRLMWSQISVGGDDGKETKKKRRRKGARPALSCTR